MIMQVWVHTVDSAMTLLRLRRIRLKSIKTVLFMLYVFRYQEKWMYIYSRNKNSTSLS